MNHNDILKICGVAFLISLTLFTITSSTYLMHKIFNPDKIVVELKGTYFQDEIAQALINTNVVESE